MSSRSQRLLLSAVLSLQLAGMVHAQLIDVDFNTNNATLSGGGPAVGPTMSGAAVLGAADDQWNGIDFSSGTAIPLIYANGSNSPVTMTFTSGGGYDVNSYSGSTPFGGTPYDALMEDYLYNDGVSQTVTLSGLVPKSMYDLVLYNAADVNAAGRTTYFTVNSNTQSSTWNGSSNTLIAGVDYVQFTSALSDSSGGLVITWTGDGSDEGDLDGFQIQIEPGPTAPGLDASFGLGGKTLISFGGVAAVAYALAIQPDGGIVVAGANDYLTNGNDEVSSLALARLNTDGALDLSFGVNGKITNASMENASAVAIQPDGKIVAAGGSAEFQLARYNTNGSLDTSFGSNGIAEALIGTADMAQAVGFQSDGKIIVSGDGRTSGPAMVATARFNTNGTLDTSFGNAGAVLTAIESASIAYGEGIQPDGKIVGGGIAITETDTTVTGDVAVARYNANGALDLTFGSLGRETNNAGGATIDGAYAMALQPDGRILLAGAAALGNSFPGPLVGNEVVNSFVVLMRLTPNGAPDPTFGNNGSILTEVGNYSDYALSLALQSDGKIIVSGATQNGNYEWFVQRYNSNGSLDSTYGDNGVRIVNFWSGTNEYPYAVAVDSSRRGVVAGDAGGLFGVARLLQNASAASLKISLTPTHTVLISWPYPSAGWNLQQNSDLRTANWVTPPETINNDGTNNFINVSPPSGNLFFRLAQP
ncbi:MAG TPA: delta-60 repeat domain-containing protein [Verrucomicrobiae bacterium]|jgi:uncharacterized delta-60 repeat protein|nr:delta-60 repeat domain-containing protein [Verrucomicrobiae bacterium]